MAELEPVHRYAAGALLSLALHQSQIHQQKLPRYTDGAEEGKPGSPLAEYGEVPDYLWISQHSNLLRPIFRYLQIDPTSWAGLEQTPLSINDVKSHIEAFVEILSQTNDNSYAKTKTEIDLAKAVNSVSHNLEEPSSSKGEKCLLDSTHETKMPSKQSALIQTLPITDNALSTISSTADIQAASTDGRLTQERKVAVLYELLAASIADVKPEAGDKSKAKRGYDARLRVALRLLATWLNVKWIKVAAMEILVAFAAAAAQEETGNSKEKDSTKGKWAQWKRGGLIGAAAVTGGALLALTGGLAAPAIAAGLAAAAPALGTIIPVIGTTGFAAAAAAAGTTVGSVAVAASFGAAGAGLSGSKMAKRTGGVEEFGFECLGENYQQGRLAVGIVVSGFLNDPEDFTKPWIGNDNDLEMYALKWETKNLLAVSSAIQDWLTSSISKEIMRQGAMMTVLSTLVAALAWPTALLALTSFIDSKWAIAVDRSDKAGKLLADVLLKGVHGNRPVTLVGFSLGARLIFKCLEELAIAGENGQIVERVVLFGAPITTESETWETVRKVVAGRFVNVYSTNDWVLGVVYRTSLMSHGLAGIQPVDLPGIENVDATDVIPGHSSYLSNVRNILEALNMDDYFPLHPPKIVHSESS